MPMPVGVCQLFIVSKLMKVVRDDSFQPGFLDVTELLSIFEVEKFVPPVKMTVVQ